MTRNKRTWILCSNNTLIQFMYGNPISSDSSYSYSLKRVNNLVLQNNETEEESH